MERKKRLGDVKYYVVIDSKGKANFSSDFQLIKGLEIIKDFYDFHEANNFTKEYNRTNVCENIQDGGKYKCEDLYNCCDCGGDDCGCGGCFSCNACIVCLTIEN